jgi:hypothetical protein
MFRVVARSVFNLACGQYLPHPAPCAESALVNSDEQGGHYPEGSSGGSGVFYRQAHLPDNGLVMRDALASDA